MYNFKDAVFCRKRPVYGDSGVVYLLYMGRGHPIMGYEWSIGADYTMRRSPTMMLRERMSVVGRLNGGYLVLSETQRIWSVLS